jgi:ubiquinone/menaquinone biosynthesis C-methylase UbiE
MKRAAICFSGAMSKLGQQFKLENSIYSNNNYVDYNACYVSIINNIVNINKMYSFDFFIHSWNTDLKNNYDALYSPKKSLYEENSLYSKEIKNKIKNIDDFGGVSKALSMKKSISLLEDFQHENNFIYDAIIVYRPDIILIKKLNLDSYDLNNIYVNSFFDCQGDFHFIMNYDNLNKFKYLYDSLDNGNLYKVHFWIKNYVNQFMNKSLIEDKIFAGIDQEVIRKIQDGTNKNISIDILSKYSLKDLNMKKDNVYTKMQRDFYNSSADIMAIENHRGHDYNPDYKEVLLKDILINNWENKSALDFGCGIGRNVDNLLNMANWSNVDGCDISSENIIRADKFLQSCGYTKDKYNLYTTTGTSLDPIKDNNYDFIMSTIVLQHIAVYDIRYSILKDIFRVLKPNGLFSFQMAQYNNVKCAKYYDNAWDAQGTNGIFDVSIDDPNNMILDLSNIGFKNITFEIRNEWDANSKKFMSPTNSKWLYFKAYK